MSFFERLSGLDRERVTHEAIEATRAVFQAAHNANGWSGDVMEESWAALPVMKEAIAKVVLWSRGTDGQSAPGDKNA